MVFDVFEKARTHCHHDGNQFVLYIYIYGNFQRAGFLMQFRIVHWFNGFAFIFKYIIMFVFEPFSE